jgi:hypothetical protein
VIAAFLIVFGVLVAWSTCLVAVWGCFTFETDRAKELAAHDLAGFVLGMFSAGGIAAATIGSWMAFH